MPTTVHMPMLSPTMEEGVIVKWHVKEGDKVSAGDVLCEIETDKATVEHTSIEEGYVRKIVVKEGIKTPVNKGIAIFSTKPDEDISGYTLEEPDYNPPTEEVTEEKTEEAPKKTAPVAGGLAEPAFVPTGPRKRVDFPKRDSNARVKASPLAKKLAKEKGLDLASVVGSGPDGRVVEKDLQGASKAGDVSFAAGEVPTVPAGTFEELEMSQMRRVIGEKLQASKTFIPHFYVNDEVNVDRLMDLRKQLIDLGMKFTFNDFVMRAVALALRKHPGVNSGYNSQSKKIIQFKTIDICVAVAIPDGLITPIVPHADYKNISQISAETKSLAKKAKEGSLSLDEFQGGSFTVSNLGMFGIHSFDAVINPPQSAILAVGGIHKKPVVVDNEVRVGNIMAITLSCDHRVIDGALAAEFVHSVKKFLENPSSLIL